MAKDEFFCLKLAPWPKRYYDELPRMGPGIDSKAEKNIIMAYNYLSRELSCLCVYPWHAI